MVMFICGVDVRPTSLRMVLTVDGVVPMFLESRWFRQPVKLERIWDTLEEWHEFYQESVGVLVGCRQDLWPAELEESLRLAGHRLEWLDRCEIRELVKCWKSMHPDPRWLRGGLMCHLVSSPGNYPLEGDSRRLAALEWSYAALRARLVELEGELFAEGRSLCPEHISSSCPCCEVPPL
jgi:hypothetical protein